MKELKEFGDVHNISIPKNIEKKTILTYFNDHECAQCDLYVSVLTEKTKIKRRNIKEKRKKRIS